MKLNFIGNIFGSSGYDNHCRNLVNALYKQNPNINLVANLPPDWMQQASDEENKMLNNTPVDSDVTIMVGLPHFWRMQLSPIKKFIGFLVWEGDSIPSFWLPYLDDDRVNQIWVPSQHTYDAIKNSFRKKRAKIKVVGEVDIGEDRVMNKVCIVPHGVDTNLFYKKEVKREEKFTFVSNKGWRAGINDRGGIQFLLKAFTEEFSKDEKVKLLCKINPAYNDQNWNLQQELNKIGITEEQLSNVEIKTDNIPYNKLVDLYNQGDCFVSPTMAESWNLPGTEAMACGLPTIQSDFGGQTDYMTTDNSWSIPTTLVQAQDGVMYEEVRWGLPDLKVLRERLRFAFEHQGEVKQKGEQALKDSEKWTWDESAKIAMENIKELM